MPNDRDTLQNDEDNATDTASQAGKNVEIATEESLFEAINLYRESMKLPPLKFDNVLRNYSLELVQNKEIIIPTVDFKVYMTKFRFLDQWRKRSTDRYMKKWIADPSKRTVLLSPGNYGATCIFSKPNTKENYVAVFVSSVFIPN
ncbi:hypothetical protein TVAG_108430 [Trichomonas vaginalis G3]|uniref:SCP domain-containing protein n=1 Tax=Trichomonas vaginalis (strain ATCC PRA-98 / G3) TaxID=412133 RepID=A2EQG7_TRIV3|nr:hypothetical protein TVAGG3_0214410 [Trichomonas vaginalis G3]EAY05109.1 hypothetical protein TVAG_108430 [Trichomonas vaginalis G3]KAI5551461.1 hypothetical protein TVAGG3_0214410 [Trichomonas vaginalis G3]|eukprot:XP_001317332.1 hypothetical protein [Trichomonas vaginalis G3]